jgi:SPP1 gp7 family putative phage head morphogenesis protein
MDALAKLFVTHLVGLHQLENLSRAKVVALVQAAFDEVKAELASGELTKYQRARQLALFKRTGSILQDAYGKVADVTAKDYKAIGGLETKFTEKVLQTSVGNTGVEINTTRLTAGQIGKIVELPIHGYTNSQWWESQALGMSNQVKRQVQLGLFTGEAMPAITKRITNVTAMRAKNEASAIVRTAVTAVSAEAQLASLKAQGDDVTEQYQIVVTYDENTCEICGDLDGEEFSYIDETAPRPPFHINCRCTIVAVINWLGLGVDLKKNPALRTFEHAAQDGPTKYKTFEDWLVNQPLAVKQEVLGKTKGTLFHEEDLSLKDFLSKDNTVITVDELVKKLGLQDVDLGLKAKLLQQQNQGLILPGETEQFTFPKGTFAGGEKIAETSVVKPAEPMQFANDKPTLSFEPGAEIYVSQNIIGREFTAEEEAIRAIAQGLKTGDAEAIKIAAEQMAARIPKNALLIPIPNSKGSTAANAALAKAIAKKKGGGTVKVLDAVGRVKPIESSRVRRQNGQAGLSIEDQAASMRAKTVLPSDGRPIFFVDNLYVTGNTAEGARIALGLEDANLLAYAQAPLTAKDLAAMSAKAKTTDVLTDMTEVAKVVNGLKPTILKDVELEAARYYQGSGHKGINKYLRTGKGAGQSDKWYDDWIKQLDDAMVKTKPLPKAITVYRGLRANEFVGDDDLDAIKEALTDMVGEEFIDLGFGSTSIDMTQAAGFGGHSMNKITFTITLPKGTKGMWMNGIMPDSAHADEAEFLLPRKSKFKVLSVKRGNNGYQIKLELVQ